MKITRIAAAAAAAMTAAAIFGAAAPANAAPEPRSAQIAAVCAGVPKTTTATDGIPGPIFFKRLQCMASLPSARPYTGPIDGVMGPNSWMGLQARLAVGDYYWLPRLEGYENANVIMALKDWANDHGYNMPLNSQWTVASYRAVADALNREY